MEPRGKNRPKRWCRLCERMSECEGCAHGCAILYAMMQGGAKAESA